MTYNVNDWYWVVAGSTTQVWASARVQYVAVSDTTYLAWLATGKAPTAIDSAASLGAVLNSQWLPSIMGAGVQVHSTGTPALNGTYPLDESTQQKIMGIVSGIAAGRGLPGGGSTFYWQDVTGAAHSFDSTAFLNFSAGLESFLYAYSQALGTLVAGGSASLPTQPVTIA